MKVILNATSLLNNSPSNQPEKAYGISSVWTEEEEEEGDEEKKINKAVLCG